MRRTTQLQHARSTALGVLAMIALGVGLAACGGPTKGATSTTTTFATTTTTTAPHTTTTLPPQTSVQLFFVRGTTLGAAVRTVATTKDPHFTTMLALMFGPNATESAAGLTTDIPPGTTLRGLEIRAGIATANFSPQFASAAPPATLAARLAQVVYTLTSYPNVTGVNIQVSKVPLVNFAGVTMTHPIGRSQVTAALPGVLLEQPAVGSSVTGALNISGLTAIDGTYDVQLLSASGQLLAGITNTAIAGSSFVQSIPFKLAAPETGLVRVFERPSSPSQPVQEYQFTVPIGP
jgi:hypothetical protein